MRWLVSLINFILGVLLAIALLAGGSVIAGRYLATKLTAPPPKPIFPNDKSVKAAKSSAKPTAAKPKPSTAATPTASTPSPSPTPKPDLPAGAYEARVNQQIGLVLRDSPGFDANQIGGIDFNERVIILEESPDKVWQRVRIESDSASRPPREGWVKAGNVERIQ